MNILDFLSNAKESNFVLLKCGKYMCYYGTVSDLYNKFLFTSAEVKGINWNGEYYTITI